MSSQSCPACGQATAVDARFCSRCGASVDPDGAAQPRDPLLGQVLMGQYRVERLLGSGGMGAVYLARQQGVDRAAAIKVLRGDGVDDDPMALARFEREARAASQLAHPNIVTIYNLGRMDDGTPFIAMEHCEGESLRETLRRTGTLAPQRAVSIALQVLDALALAHARGVIHRDLKPANLMLTTRGDERDVVKVLDFGIAKLQSSVITRSGLLLGTPLYMAPEQLGDGAVDGRADLYAVGVLLFEMLAGDVPLRANDLAALALKKVSEDAPSLTTATGGAVSTALADAVARALARDVDARYGDARAMSAALQRPVVVEPTAQPDDATLPPHEGRRSAPGGRALAATAPAAALAATAPASALDATTPAAALDATTPAAALDATVPGGPARRGGVAIGDVVARGPRAAGPARRLPRSVLAVAVLVTLGLASFVAVRAWKAAPATATGGTAAANASGAAPSATPTTRRPTPAVVARPSRPDGRSKRSAGRVDAGSRSGSGSVRGANGSRRSSAARRRAPRPRPTPPPPQRSRAARPSVAAKTSAASASPEQLVARIEARRRGARVAPSSVNAQLAVAMRRQFDRATRTALLRRLLARLSKPANRFRQSEMQPLARLLTRFCRMKTKTGVSPAARRALALRSMRRDAASVPASDREYEKRKTLLGLFKEHAANYAAALRGK